MLLNLEVNQNFSSFPSPIKCLSAFQHVAREFAIFERKVDIQDHTVKELDIFNPIKTITVN